jgi:hypothetical protein
MSTAALPFQPPRPIRRKVALLRTAVRLYVVVEGLAALAVVVGSAFWLGLGIDWLLEPRPAIRVAMGALAGIAFAYVAWWYLLRRAFAPLPSDSLALLVERTHPQLAEGLVTTVQAADQHESGATRLQMLDVSARRTVEALGDVRLGRVFDFKPLNTKFLIASILFAAIGVFAATESEAFGFWLERMRLSPDRWPRLASLSVLGFDERDGQRVVNVARDDSYDLQVLASITGGHQVPDEIEVRWRLADGRRGRGPMMKIGEAAPGRDDAQLFQYTFKVSSDVTFDVIGGDDRIRGLRLHPVERPAVKSLALDCTFPGYMGRESRLVPVASGRAELPEGSKAICRAEANKPLVKVIVHDPVEQVDLPTTVSADHPTEFSFDLGAVTGDRALTITMHDADGVENRDPFRLAVSALPDQAPEVNVQLRGIGVAVTPQARIPLVGRLLDDYGLTEAWFGYVIDEQEPQRRQLRTQPSGAVNLRMTEPFDLAEPDPQTTRPRVELKPGQRLTLSVEARDAYDLTPDPHVGSSPRFQLDVVTPSQLRALLEKRELGLRQRFEATYEKMLGIRDLIERIDLAAQGNEADDTAGATTGDEEEEELTPERQRERDVARVNGSRQSATQLAFEITGVASGFDDILAELVNNRVDTEELKQRLEQGISEPLKEISGDMVPRFEERLAELQTRLAAGSPESASPQLPQSLRAARAESEAVAEAMKRVLDRMLELEGYNELVDLLRGIVTEQEALREETLKLQREKLRELLEE